MRFRILPSIPIFEIDACQQSLVYFTMRRFVVSYPAEDDPVVSCRLPACVIGDWPVVSCLRRAVADDFRRIRSWVIIFCCTLL